MSAALKNISKESLKQFSLREALPQLLLLGRPNVGKSTLFNRLVGRRQAIVDDQPGVTRDLHYGKVKHQGKEFTVVDSGGLIPGASEKDLSAGVRKHVEQALQRTSLVCFLVDGRLGLTPAENELARWLRQWGGEVFLVVHKIDEPQHQPLVSEFFRLGFERVFPVSAESRLGLKSFLDAVVAALPAVSLKEKASEEALPVFAQENLEKKLKLTLIGQPNSGKSTLLNAMLGEERALVSDVAGTTLDPVAATTTWGGLDLDLVDTAGIKRRHATKGKIEKVGVLKALAAVKQADLVLLVVDATLGFTVQDLKILAEAEGAGRGLLIVLNKWDLVKPGTKLKDLTAPFHERFKRQAYVPMVALSAKTGRGLKSLQKKIHFLQTNYGRRIATGELNRFLQESLKVHPLPAVQGKALNLTYLTQTHAAPPRLVLFTNHPKLVPETYLRFLERRLRKDFDFTGIPIKWSLRKK